MAYEVREVTSNETWDKFLAKHPESNFLQSWQYGNFYENYGRTIWRKGYYSGEELVGVMLAVLEPAKRGRYITVAGGPILNWNDAEIVSAWSESVKSISKSSGAVFARVRP